MNILYFRYALEVAESGSLSRAAERLYIGQPNLSRAMRELEGTLGTELFERSPRGMVPTPDGEVFLQYAKKILAEVDAVEVMFRSGAVRQQRFSLSAPAAGYISTAFALISREFDAHASLEVNFREAEGSETVAAVSDGDAAIGIIRYDAKQDKFHKTRLDARGINYELIAEFEPVVICSAECAASCGGGIGGLVEVTCPAQAIPLLSVGGEQGDGARMFLSDRAACLDVLACNAGTFMWSSPEPPELLRQYGLAEVRTVAPGRIFKDVMLSRADHSFSETEKNFISELCRIRRETF